MTLDRADRGIVQRLIARAVALADKRNLLKHAHRRAAFTLEDIAVGNQEVVVSWTSPIGGPFDVLVSPTVGANFVGLVTAGPKVATKTATGVTIIVANRAAVPCPLATFDVLAFPLGEG